jgi:hypothetical protein
MTTNHERLQQVAASFRTVTEIRAAGGYATIYQQMAAGTLNDPELLAIAATARPEKRSIPRPSPPVGRGDEPVSGAETRR